MMGLYMVWLCIFHPIAFVAFCQGHVCSSDKMRQLPADAPSCWGTRLRKALFFGVLLFPPIAFAGFVLAHGDICVQGFPHFHKGGACVCDQRDLSVVEGIPNYRPSELIPPNLKVAFVGDMDTEDVRKVYALIRDEGDVSAVVL